VRLGSGRTIDFYNTEGQRIRESSETEDKRKAAQMLKDKEGRAARGEPVIAGRATYDEVRDALMAHYQSTGTRDVAEVGPRVAHLDRFFRGWRADQITSKAVADYIVKRQGEETVSPVQKIRKRPSAGTVNREIGVLGRMLRLAVEHGRLARVPGHPQAEGSGPAVRLPGARAVRGDRGAAPG